MNDSTIDKLLNTAVQACNDLILILEKEKKLLLTGENEQLEGVSTEKIRLLSILNECEPVFDSPTPDKQDGNKTTAHGNDKHPIKNTKKWAHVQNLLSQCQLLNRRNGYVINTSLKNSQASLAILRGQDQTENMTYTHDGMTNNTLSSRPIAKI